MNRIGLLVVLLSVLGKTVYADTYSLVMQPPNGYHVPKVIGASGDPVILTGYDYFDWFGITHHRTWYSPGFSSLPADSTVTTAAAFASATEAIRQNPLRQATSSDYYIDWNFFNSKLSTTGMSETMDYLSSLNIKSMICCTQFISSSSISGDWVNILKYWKHWYSMVYYFASHYDVTMYEFRNEPHAWVDYNTWESHWLVAADAMRKAMEDVNTNYKNLTLSICGPTEPGPYWDYSLPDPYVDVHGWGSVSWAKVKTDIYGNANSGNPWNYGMYDYHRYTDSGASVEAQILQTRTDIAAARNDPHPTIPLLITELNTQPGGQFTTKQKDTEDLFYGISMAQILQATAGLGPDGLGNEGGFFEFKLGAHASGGPFEGIQNRVCYTSTYAPYNYGGITRGGVCFQMYARHFRGGKPVIPFTVTAGSHLKRRTIAVADEQKRAYYIYGSNTSGIDAEVTIDLNALSVETGSPATIQRVDAFNTGQITEVLTIEPSKILRFSAPNYTAFLINVPMEKQLSIVRMLAPVADTYQTVASTGNHGAETTMKVSLHSSASAERRAGLLRFDLSSLGNVQRVLLKLCGKNAGTDPSQREILHVYAVSGKAWDEDTALSWTTAPGLGRYTISTGLTGIADGTGTMIDIEDNYAGTTKGTGLGICGRFLGAVSFYSSTYKANYLDVTDYIKSLVDDSTAEDVTFIVARIVRYNVNDYDNPYYYNLGQYDYNGRIVEIATKENADADLRPCLVGWGRETFYQNHIPGLVNAWLTADPSWNIAPLPFRDEIVNLRDFEAFSKNYYGIDMDLPTPNPMAWAVPPYGVGTGSIAMTAVKAKDPSGVEYYFACTQGGGHDSGWQDSATYTDLNLTPGASYAYTVKARDKSPNQNTTAVSSEQFASPSWSSLIDDFTSDVLDSHWVINSVLVSGGSPAIFDTTTNDDQLSISYNGGSYHQTMMLRSDRTLDVGDTLKVDYVSGNKGGLCIAEADTKSVREPAMAFMVRDGAVRVYHFDGSGSYKDVAIAGTLRELWIRRIAASDFEFTTVGTSGSNSATRSVSSSTVGNAIGFFSDLRSAEAGTPAVFDNFRLE